MGTFRVLYRTPSQDNTGYFTQVNAATEQEALWETAKTLDPSAILVSVDQIAETTATEGSTDAPA